LTQFVVQVEPDIGIQLYISIGLLTVGVMTYALLRQWVYEEDIIMSLGRGVAQCYFSKQKPSYTMLVICVNTMTTTVSSLHLLKHSIKT